MYADAGQAFFTVDVGGVDGRAYQRAGGTGVDGDVFTAGPFTGQARVARGFVQPHVAGHGGDGADAEFVGRGHGQEQRNHVVGARVGVDDKVDRGGLEGGGGGHEGESL